jgi:hypothetical protein
MPELTGRCPICEAELTVTHLRCQRCGTGLEGTFTLTKFDRLSREQLRFVDVFVKNRGVIRDVERELGISYPTVRSRLDEVIRALGYDAPPGAPEAPGAGTSGAYSATAAVSWAPGAGGASTSTTGSTPPAPPAAEGGGVSAARRREILDRLSAGELSAEQAIQLLRGDSPEAAPEAAPESGTRQGRATAQGSRAGASAGQDDADDADGAEAPAAPSTPGDAGSGAGAGEQ